MPLSTASLPMPTGRGAHRGHSVRSLCEEPAQGLSRLKDKNRPRHCGDFHMERDSRDHVHFSYISLVREGAARPGRGTRGRSCCSGSCLMQVKGSLGLRVALWVGESSCAPQGCGFGSRSGHVWDAAD